MFGISFFAPLVFSPTSFSDRVTDGMLEKTTQYVDAYFGLLEADLAVLLILEPHKGHSHNPIRCFKIEQPRSARWKKVVIIISYFLIFPIILGLILKFILRIVVKIKHGPFLVELPGVILPRLSSEDLRRIQKLDKEVYGLVEKYREAGVIPEEERKKLGITVLSSTLGLSKNSTASFVYTCEKYPRLVFRSCLSEVADSFYTSALISDSVMQELNLNLLYCPRIRLEKSLVPGLSLIISEALPLEWIRDPLDEDSGVRKGRPFTLDMLPAMEQFVLFIQETSYGKFFRKDLPFIMPTVSGESPQLVLMNTAENVLPSDDCIGVFRLKIEAWTQSDFFPTQRDMAIALSKAIYKECPTRQIKSYLEGVFSKNGWAFDENEFN